MSDLISRAELFNRLSVIKTPMEANEYKAEVYKTIQGMETAKCKSVSVSIKEEMLRKVLDTEAIIKRIKEEYELTEDTITVVRCKHCRHQEHCHETIAHTKAHDGFREHWSEPIEWCSRGERKGGDSE